MATPGRPPPFTPSVVPRAVRRAVAPAAGRIAVAAALGRPPATAAVEALAAAAAAVPPASLARWAEAEGVAALLVAALDGVDAAVPAPVWAAWCDTAARGAERAARLAGDRQRLADALRDGGVPWRPLKGAWLADHAYGSPAHRPMADTDLWVDRYDLPRADAALVALGYRRASSSWKHLVYRRPDERVVDRRGEHADNPRPVEVHPWLGEGLRGVTFDIGRAAGDGSNAGGGAWPDVATMMLHVAAHATVDALSHRLRLLSLVDVAVLAHQLDGAAWRRVVDVAVAPAAARFVWPALALAQRELAADVPAATLAALADGVRPALRRWVGAADVDAVGRWAAADRPRRLVDIPRIWPIGWREAATVWRHVAWPPRSALADRYPRLAASAAWPAMYAAHTAFSVRRLGQRLAQRRRRSLD